MQIRIVGPAYPAAQDQIRAGNNDTLNRPVQLRFNFRPAAGKPLPDRLNAPQGRARVGRKFVNLTNEKNNIVRSAVI